MTRVLFGNVTDPSIKVGSRKWYTVPLSLAVHSLVLLALIVVPLLATGTLPLPNSSVVFVPIVTTAVSPPPAVRRLDNVREPSVNPHAAPLEAPDSITKEADVDFGFEKGVEGGTGLEELGVVYGAEALPEPPPPPAQPRQPVRAGGDIKRPEKIHDVAPSIPLLR